MHPARDAVGGEGDNSVGMPGGALVLAEARTRPASARGIPGAVGEIAKEQSKRERERERERGRKGEESFADAPIVNRYSNVDPSTPRWRWSGCMRRRHATALTPSSLSPPRGARLCPEKYRTRTGGRIRERARRSPSRRGEGWLVRATIFSWIKREESVMTLTARTWGTTGVCRCAAGLHRKRTRTCLPSVARGRGAWSALTLEGWNAREPGSRISSAAEGRACGGRIMQLLTVRLRDASSFANSVSA